jgi:hypothetical protein
MSQLMNDYLNGQTDLTNIDEVSDILGNNFKEK